MYPWAIKNKVERFDALHKAHWLDFSWEERNHRSCRCGRCNMPLKQGEGKGYIEFMNDGYRFIIKYLCVDCLSIVGQK